MKRHGIRRLIATLVVAALIPLAAISGPAFADDVPVDQPLTAVSPADGARVSTPFPTFAWVVPSNPGSTRVIVNTSPALVDGQLPDSGKTYYDTESAGVGVAKVKAAKTFSPGTYYWQAVTQDAGAEFSYISPVRKLVVPILFDLAKLKTKVEKNGANNLNEVVVNGTLRCVVPYGTKNKPTLTIQVFKGKKKLGSQAREAGDCNSWTKVKQFANWQPQPHSIKKGTKLTVKVWASFGKTKSVVQVLKLTWK